MRAVLHSLVDALPERYMSAAYDALFTLWESSRLVDEFETRRIQRLASADSESAREKRADFDRESEFDGRWAW